MTNLEKRIDQLEKITATNSHNYKLLMHHEGEPEPVLPDDGQPCIVVTFVKTKQREPDHDET